MSESDMSEASSSEYEEASDEDYEEATFEEMGALYSDLRGLCRHARIGHKLTADRFCEFINAQTNNGRKLAVTKKPNGAPAAFFIDEPVEPKKQKAQPANETK
jgi:hypothetical protein